MLRTLKAFDLKEKRILIRVDFNVPIENDRVTDDFRIRSALPTIQYCLRQGASVVLMSHLGRPKGNINPKMSLIPAGETLADLLEMPIKFSDDCVSEDSRDVSLGIKPGEIHLLENLRFHPEETHNDSRFSALLAKHGQIYMNDAFGTAHRSHASNIGVVANFIHKGIGFLIEKELQFLTNVMKRPQRPLVLVLGGAKIETKLGLIHRFIDKADSILIGGGMAFTFMRTMGREVGKSLVDQDRLKVARSILSKARGKVILELPKDFVCASSIKDAKNCTVCEAGKIPVGLMGLDIGPKTIDHYREIIGNAGTVLWNGPMGVFEVPEFEEGTRALGQAIVTATKNGTVTVVGGGDSAAAMKKYNMIDGASHVSTGGGAFLEFLSGNPLPSISALER